MHECPECGQACDCDGEDTWIGWPANIDCSHDCEDEWCEDECDDERDDSEYDWCYEQDSQPSFFQRAIYWIKDLLHDLTPFRCDVCSKWSLSKHRPCCSQKCADEWVPF